jgi:hypothetical protein
MFEMGVGRFEKVEREICLTYILLKRCGFVVFSR